MIGVYDLQLCPTTFDFHTFLATVATYAKAIGSKPHVLFVKDGMDEGFRSGKLTVEQKRIRFHDVLIPSCALIGAPARS